MTRRREFEAVRLKGQSAGGRLLALGVLPGLFPFSKAKAGVIVPKALGTAPVRNQIKRRLREIIREAVGQFPPAWGVVTIARRGSVGADYAALRSEWRRLARKTGVLPRPAHSERPAPAPPSAADRP